MRFSEHWLRTFVDPALDSEALAACLTMAGLEVEAVELVAPPFSNVVVAQVLAVEPHPQADRLRLCRVDVGMASPLSMVCGADNVVAGMKTPCAKVGARLPGMEIRAAKLRGVESQGMLCSAAELGLAEGSDGLLVLPEDAPVGADLRTLLDLDDRIFTLKLTPNRADCLSVLGVAREVAALTGAPLQRPPAVTVAARTDECLRVEVEDVAACPRYCGRLVRGIDLGRRTPGWMVRRLERSGIKSIHPVVDVTNYVLLERGQPLHAFDATRIEGAVVVRRALSGERLTLLDSREVVLAPDMLVIADRRKALALAGIMGGAASAVHGDTRDVFLEAAFFAPQVIQGRARRLSLATEAAHRFERGVDFAVTRECLEYATQLILEIVGGTPGPIVEVIGTLPERSPIRLRPARAEAVLGMPLANARLAELLGRLGISVREEGELLVAVPPSYRFDLALEEDLVEEVARMVGYEHIPSIAPKAPLAMSPAPEHRREEARLKERLVARDYQEVITYSFVDEALAADLAERAPLRLENPLSAQLAVMRPSLWCGLIEALRFNHSHRQPRVRLFELGRVFFGTAPEEQPMWLGGVAFGTAWPEQWGVAARRVDFHDVKGDLETLFFPRHLECRAEQHPALHPGAAARLVVEGRPVGWLGVLHPRLVQKYELPSAPVLFELELEAVLARTLPRFAEVPKFPPVRRDLAVLVDAKLAVGEVLAALREASSPVVTELALFDVYQGKGTDSGKKSLAFRVVMQDTRKTLTDAEADAVIGLLVQILADRFHARLR